jgi:hypothetical protein
MNNIKKLFILIFVCPFLLTITAQAHFIKTNNDFGLTFHIDPGDDPVVGKKATVYLEIKDKQNKFAALDCDCRAKITGSGGEVYNSKIFTQTNQTNDIAKPAFQVVFPKKDIYTLEIQGKSMTNTFSEFTIKTEIRVEKMESNETGVTGFLQKHWLHGVIFGGGFLVLFVLILREYRLERKEKLTKQNPNYTTDTI